MTNEQFIAHMETVWGGPCEPGPNGGVIMYQHPDYDQDHNAMITARRLGMVRTGTTQIDGDWWPMYRFPDDISPGVAIKHDGSAIHRGKNIRLGRRRP